MYSGSGTVDRIASGQPVNAATYAAAGGRYVCSVYSADFCVK